MQIFKTKTDPACLVVLDFGNLNFVFVSNFDIWISYLYKSALTTSRISQVIGDIWTGVWYYIRANTEVGIMGQWDMGEWSEMGGKWRTPDISLSLINRHLRWEYSLSMVVQKTLELNTCQVFCSQEDIK